MPRDRVTQKAWKAALDKVLSEASSEFPDHPEKLAQLGAHIETCKMVVDDLHTTVAYTGQPE